MKLRGAFVYIPLIASVVSLFLEQLPSRSRQLELATEYVDYLVLILLVGEIIVEYKIAPYKRIYLKRNIFPLAFAAVFVGLFAYNKVLLYTDAVSGLHSLPLVVIIIRNVFIILKVFTRLRRLSSIVEDISTHPAQTITVSFLLVILAGTLLLMMPFTGTEGGLPFLDSLFTATSAVCVTGLIVVDTATMFTVYGQVIILVLIQIGGLGIMVLSYFVVFVMRRSVSLEDKMLIAYMLSERDMTRLSRSLKTIIYTTISIEVIGAVVLYFGMRGETTTFAGAALQSVFHSISAFCNAGFSLFSDSLMRFTSNVPVTLTIALLVIAGGASFAVINNIKNRAVSRVRALFRKGGERIPPVSLNTYVVLVVSGVLLVTGMIAFYALEHRNALSGETLGTQYLASFFQSVTLRTAGFNTVAFDRLLPGAYLVLSCFMIIGGASGSTAGGIKVNTAAVLIAGSLAGRRNEPAIHRYSISEDTVKRAFFILLFAVLAVSIGTILLTLSEDAPVEHLFFEAVSAFGTVGLSSGLTPALSGFGKVVIIVLMFIGRLGPLTILAAASIRSKRGMVSYPKGEIAVG